MKLAKINAFLTGVVLLVLGVAFASAALGLSVAPPSGGTALLGLLILQLFSILFFEIAALQMRKGLAMDEAKLEQKTAWSGIGSFLKYLDLLFLVFLLMVIVALAGLFGPSLVDRLKQGIVFTNEFFVLLAIYIVYLVVRGLLLSRLGKPSSAGKPSGMANILSRMYPSYALTTDGLRIDLKIAQLWGPPRDYVVDIKFDDINEISAFNYPEAEAYLRYKIGPDVGLLAKNAEELANYTQDKKQRPSVFFVEPSTMAGKTLLLKGSDLFYFFSVWQDDVSDLLDAFEKYKKKP